MGAKHYQKLGKTKLVKCPEAAIAFSKELWRILDEKEDYEARMELLKAIARLDPEPLRKAEKLSSTAQNNHN